MVQAGPPAALVAKASAVQALAAAKAMAAAKAIAAMAVRVMVSAAPMAVARAGGRKEVLQLACQAHCGMRPSARGLDGFPSDESWGAL